VQSSRLEIEPEYQIRWKRDVYGNSVAIVTFLHAAAELVISSEVIVEHYEEEPLEFVLEDSAQRFPFQYDPSEQIDLAPYQSAIYPQDQPVLNEWLANVFDPEIDTDTITMLTTINRKIANELQYQMREEPGVQSPAQTLSTGMGSCRDFATLFIEICRGYGLASRFISGYTLNESIMQGHTSTHAWAEVLLPGSGWRGFDSTSGLVVSGEHIAVAVHRHPEAIPPVAGTYVGAVNKPAELSVEVRVTHIPD
jgi:transglutaminase-like putative cysteine protease